MNWIMPAGCRVSLAGAALLAITLASADFAVAQSDSSTARRYGAPDVAPRRVVRPPTRIRVNPGYPYRTFSTDYPVPYEYEYPGPNGVRQCKSRLVQEMRPSGPVVVPRMRCWWEQTSRPVP